MISSRASSPASLCARSITTVAAPSFIGSAGPASGTVKRFIRPGLCSASGRKVRSPSTTVSRGIPAASAADAAARVFSTLKRDRPAEGHRHLDQLDQRVRVGTRAQHRDPAVDDGGGAAAFVEGLADRRRVRVAGEDPRARPDHAAHREDPGVVAVEHRPAAAPGDPRDHRLHLGELVEGVDALQAEVVGADVGHHRHVVAGDPDPLEQDPAARGLGDGELHAGQAEHGARPRSGRSSRRPPRARRRGRSRRCWTSRRPCRRCGRCARSSGWSWSCRWCR